MQTYRITLTIKNHSHKPERIFKWRNTETLKEAWVEARKICREYNKEHRGHLAVITGVCKN